MMQRKVLKVRTKLLKQLAENNKFFSQIQIINEDFTDIDFNDVDDTFLFSYGNIKVKDDLTISRIMFWYMNNRDNFKRIYETLIENYNPLQDKNTNHTRTYERKQAKLNTNTFLNGERQTENIKATQTNDNYATTFESSAIGDKRLTSENVYQGHTDTVKISDIPDNSGKKGETIESGYDTEVTKTVGDETISGHDINVSRETNSGLNGSHTSQELLNSEILLRINFNFVKIFTEKFLNEMTLNIWGCENDY